MSVLVTGPTGTIGMEVLRLFAQRRQPGVRALLHSSQKAGQVAKLGAQPIVGAFEDKGALRRAMSGVRTVILITPAGPSAVQQAANVVDVAKKTGAQKIVRISAIKADPAGPTNNTIAHAATEAAILKSGMHYVFLRPNLFMQNLFMAADGIRLQGQFSFATGAGKAGMVDTRDVAACAVVCAQSDQWNGQTLELTGPEAISYFDVAKSLSVLAAKPIQYLPISPEDMFAMIAAAGWGEWMAALARDYGRAYADGWGEFTTDAVRDVTGAPPRSVGAFIRDVLLPAL